MVLTQQAAERKRLEQQRAQELAAHTIGNGAPHYAAPQGVYNKEGRGAPIKARWNPTEAQLKVLEDLFAKGHGTPHKDRLVELTDELRLLGPIEESNVYNWFQNKKARTKRKQQEEEEAAAAGGDTKIAKADESVGDDAKE